MSWFKKKPEPPISPGNPGQGASLQVGFANADRNWSESVDVVDVLAELLASQGLHAQRSASWLELDSGLCLRPQVSEFAPREPEGVRTTSTIQVTHRDFGPEGFFEYQHATGPDLNASFAAGFRSWADIDLPVILDALRESPQACSILSLSVPRNAAAGQQHLRRVVLGPTSHLVDQSAQAATGGQEAHEFCPCCLLTNSMDAFWPLLESQAFGALRLFAMRDENGGAQADCRLNGEDFPSGQEALLQYVSTWPARGVEWRKQLVIVQNAIAVE